MSFAYAQTNTTSTTQVPASTPVGQPQAPGFSSMLTLFMPMLLVIYFFMIRPQNKKFKEQQEMLKQIKSGDEIIMTSGIYGTVTGVTENVLTVEIANNVKVKVAKGQVAANLSNQKNISKGQAAANLQKNA